MRSRIACSAFALALFSHVGPCFADPTAAERAVAETLFKDAKKLMARGKVPEACEKFASSYKIDPAGGTLLNLAMCHEVEGKTATAWTEFNEALSLAKKSGRADRQKAANEHIAALEPRLSRLTITPPAGAPPGFEIRIDGVPVAAAAIGTAIPVDPGEHVASASAPGKKPWEVKITLVERKPATLAVPPLEDAQPKPPPPPPGVPWKLPAGIAGLGVGATLLAVGTGFGVHAVSLGGEVRTGCPKGACSPAGWEALGDGRAAARVSNGTLIAGGAAAIAGAVLVVLAVVSGPPSDGAPSARGPSWIRRAADSFELQPSWAGGSHVTARGVF
jgi:hypothetical protein